MEQSSKCLGNVMKCSVCKTTKTDAWYKNKKFSSRVLCNFCCDSSGSSEPKDWTGLCVHCLVSEAAYPIYTSGFKQFACCKCYLENRRQIKKARNEKMKEKVSNSSEKTDLAGEKRQEEKHNSKNQKKVKKMKLSDEESAVHNSTDKQSSSTDSQSQRKEDRNKS